MFTHTLSNCCNAELKTWFGGEGIIYYECVKCGLVIGVYEDRLVEMLK